MEPQYSIDKNSIVKNSIDKGKRFTPPTQKEIQSFMTKYASDKKMQIAADVEAERFFDYYESCGWTIGKNGKRMRSWEASARSWVRRILDREKEKTATVQNDRCIPLHDRKAIDYENLYA